MAENEDKFVRDREQEKISAIRKKRRLEALQKEEREGIAATLDTTEAVAEEALDLGFDAETSRILHLVPLIQVAWADGTVSNKEQKAVLAAAESAGIDPQDEAYEFLEALLAKKPTDLFFERVNHVIANILKDHGDSGETIMSQLQKVASASGGFLGFGKTVSDEEAKLIEELKDILKVQ